MQEILLRDETYDNEAKIESRLKLIQITQEVFETQSLPDNRQWWSMCGEQLPNQWSEINQVVGSGLVKSASQFCGVDIQADLIRKNQLTHPAAKFIALPWNEAVQKHEFNPGVVNLDTKHLVDSDRLFSLLSGTLPACPDKTLVFVNAQYNAYASKALLSLKPFTRFVKRAATGFRGWAHLKTFEYQSRETSRMITFVLHRDINKYAV